MANFLTKMKQGLPHTIERKGVPGYLVDKGERYAAAAGFGFLKGYYRERAVWRGVPVDALAGVGLTLGSALLEIFAGGRSALAPHLNAIGDAGVMSWFGSMGAARGAKASGRQVYVLAPGSKPPAVLPAGLTAVGADVGVGAAYLSAEEIARFSEQR